MSSHFYEVSLAGSFYAKDLKAVLNRIALHADSAQRTHTREIVFEPVDAFQQRAAGTDPLLLRARKEVLEKGTEWCVCAVPGVWM
jgi:mediator of RNA polymerase II transcription subunit 18